MTVLKVQPQVKLDAMINDFFNDLPSFNKKSTDASPLVNITETKNAFNLELYAPGRKKEDFKINVDKNLLIISSEVEEAMKDENELVVRKEFSLGKFKRSFTINDKISTEQIQAIYENGLLKVILPKNEVVHTSKNIEVK